ncbi:hypothetical protein [Uliginosibacterium gangwonense]|uniref:hypothetical protein n=1 Tax=Uliginosibacterium gangwonense TaxID=392736 RepID=UPI00035CBDDE|nr:hypothetical protein [Uliginosibacterium gangwonense]
MALRLSTGLVNAVMASSSLKAAIEGANGFVIDIYSGTQPTSPDAAATGTLLVTVSNNGAGTGMHMGATATAGVISKAGAETWSGTAVAAGTAGWFRCRQVGDTGAAASNSAIRFDGAIATSGAEMTLGSLTISASAPFVLSTANFTLPMA